MHQEYLKKHLYLLWIIFIFARENYSQNKLNIYYKDKIITIRI